MSKSLTAVYPGTFDPMTLGHQELMRPASALSRAVTVLASKSAVAASGMAALAEDQGRSTMKADASRPAIRVIFSPPKHLSPTIIHRFGTI